MLITRCPTCATTFRIRPEQLNLRGGRVRCGKCHNAFSALASLDELPDTEAELTIAASTPSAVQASAMAPAQRTNREPTPPTSSPPAAPLAAPVSQTSVGQPARPPASDTKKDDVSGIDFDLGSSHDKRIEPTMPVAASAPYSPFDAPPTAPYMSESAVTTLVDGLGADANADEVMKALEASITEAIEVRGLDAEFDADEALDIDVNLDEEADKAPEPVFMGNAASRMLGSSPAVPLPTLPTIDVEESDDEADAAAFDHDLPTEPLPEDGLHEPLAFADELMDPGTVFLDDEVTEIPQKSRARARPNGWLLGSLALLLAAMAQGAFTFRMELARAFPATRYALEEVCASLGCTVPFPRDADQILVEGTDLTPDPSGTGHYRLIVTLRNKANYPQSWPQLELTLTDRFDRALSRRVLSPHEWVPASLAARPAFDAQGEVTANVAISTDLPAAGYRVYTFYP